MVEFSPEVKQQIAIASIAMNLVVIEEKGFLSTKRSKQDNDLYDAVVGNAVIKAGVSLGLVEERDVLRFANNRDITGLQNVIKSILHTVDRDKNLKSSFLSEFHRELSKEMSYVKGRLDLALEQKTALDVDSIRALSEIQRNALLKGGTEVDYHGYKIRLDESDLRGLIKPSNNLIMKFNNPPVKLNLDIPRMSDIQDNTNEVLYS